jgi:hypothetical protein
VNRVTARNACGIVALALAACSPVTRDQTQARTDPERRPPTRLAPEASGSQAMQPMLEQIRADAAQRAGVALDEVKVLAVEAVIWSDGSLGCPEPGMMYTQALVPGYRIRVDASGTVLVYHAGPQHTFVHCPPDRAREPSPIDPT